MAYKLKDIPIVISFTTTPYRIDKIAPILRSLTAQNVHITDIYLNIPTEFQREPQLKYVIPDWLQNSKVKILRTRDYGPATKLLGLLEHKKFADGTIIITLDDDLVYPRNTILHLAYAALQNPNCAIGLSGADLYKNPDEISTDDADLGMKKRYKYAGSVAVLQGYAGIAYRSNFLFADELMNVPQQCRYTDDIWFSYNLAKHNIQRKTISNAFIHTNMLPVGAAMANGLDALHRQTSSMADKNLACIAYLH